MRVARVVTNETCSQNCAFCEARRPVERASVASASAVRARIEAAVRAGAGELVLTGGEPTLRRDLPALVAHARRSAAGAPLSIVLETNGALVDLERARSLAAAGLDRARVHLPAWGDACDAITRDEGGFARTRAAIRALASAGLAVELATPIVRANLACVSSIPRSVVDDGLPVEAIVLGIPVSAPLEADLGSLVDAARAVERVAAVAREVGLALRLDSAGAAVPPCLFARPASVAHLFALTSGGANRPGFSRVTACAACLVRDRCPGFPRAALDREPALESRPITEDRARRRLSLASSVAEQVKRELVTREVYRVLDGTRLPAAIVRIGFHCNQACRFCFVSTHLPPPTHEAIVGAIADIAREGGLLTLSGGEPTLSPRLLEYVRLGRTLGARDVALQTNAVRLAEGTLAADLVAAGVAHFQVSLHASDPVVSDAITETPGTFEATARGIDALHRAGAALHLNYVFCRLNMGHFPEHVRSVAARWPGARITVSFVAASTDVVPRETSLVPRYAEILPELGEGLRLARALGVELDGLDSMCGLPLCLVPGDLAPFFRLAELPSDADGGELLKPPACRACALDARCFGVRRGYAELYGVSELAPVSVAAAARWPGGEDSSGTGPRSSGS